MAVKKSVRTTTGRGGRPRGEGVRHTTSHIQQDSEIEILTPDDDIHRVEEMEDDIRESIRLAVVKNLKNIPTWFNEVGVDDPKGALTLMKDYIEFVLPKLQRTDSKLDTSSPLELKFESIDDYKVRKDQEEAKNPKINPDNDFPTND
jgi:hypothetical protein